MNLQSRHQAQAGREPREAKLRAQTEWLDVERELQHRRLRQAAILEALPMALYEASFDDQGRLLRRFVGGDIARIDGEDAAGLASGALRWEDRIAGADVAELDRRIAECHDSPVALQYRWSCGDGHEIHVLDQCVKSPHAEGAWVGTLIDVSAQRELEQQLVQARKAEALGQLTGGIAHDFNNLLASVLGGLRLLEARVALGGRERRILDHMRHAAESGAEVVRRLMAFARKQELTPTSVDPRELCESVADLIDHALDGPVTVEWQVPETVLHLFADKAQLELALVNLVVNARDAMPDGGKIVVAIDEPGPEQDQEGREYLRIRIRDEGGGIPPELIERVTEPFFTTKAPGKGTGLGLSMVAGFVQQSGGTFELKSEPGRGTEVAMILPATRSAKQTRHPANGTDHAPEITIGSVLVVDDDASVLLIVSEQLRDLGLEVTTAEGAKHALTVLEGEADEPDFVLTDFSMPGLDGMRLLAALRDRWPHIRGAIMTGNPQESLTCCDPSFAVIHKPLNLAELQRLLAGA